MNRSWVSSAVATTLAASCLLASPLPTAAEESAQPKVTKLRSPRKVVLYDCQDRNRSIDFPSKEFRDPWPVVANPLMPAPANHLVVIVWDQEYCVKASDVETNIKTVGKGLIDPKDRGGAASGRK